MNRYLLLSNNPLVAENYKNVFFYKRPAFEILVMARNMVHQGYQLLSHPLPANFKMISSPYKTIVFSNEKKSIDIFHLEVMENSILKLMRNVGEKGMCHDNDREYQKLDLWYTTAVLRELEKIC